MLQQYGPDLLVQCENVLALSQEIVRNWLATYMFRGELAAEERAGKIAAWLSNHANFKIHGRYINREKLREQGLKILDLEGDKTQQDFVLSLYHATTHTFAQTGAMKIIENHLGSAYINQVQQIVVQKNPPQSPTLPSSGRHEEPPFPKKKDR